MNRLTETLKKDMGTIVFTLIALAVFLAVFKLGNMDMSLYFMGAEAVLFILFAYLVFSFVNYRKTVEKNEKIEELERENRELVNRLNEEKKSINEYFLLWIHQIKTPITAAKLLIDREEVPVTEIKRQICPNLTIL